MRGSFRRTAVCIYVVPIVAFRNGQIYNVTGIAFYPGYSIAVFVVNIYVFGIALTPEVDSYGNSLYPILAAERIYVIAFHSERYRARVRAYREAHSRIFVFFGILGFVIIPFFEIKARTILCFVGAGEQHVCSVFAPAKRYGFFIGIPYAVRYFLRFIRTTFGIRYSVYRHMRGRFRRTAVCVYVVPVVASRNGQIHHVTGITFYKGYSIAVFVVNIYVFGITLAAEVASDGNSLHPILAAERIYRIAFHSERYRACVRAYREAHSRIFVFFGILGFVIIPFFEIKARTILCFVGAGEQHVCSVFAPAKRYGFFIGIPYAVRYFLRFIRTTFGISYFVYRHMRGRFGCSAAEIHGIPVIARRIRQIYNVTGIALYHGHAITAFVIQINVFGITLAAEVASDGNSLYPILAAERICRIAFHSERNILRVRAYGKFHSCIFIF